MCTFFFFLYSHSKYKSMTSIIGIGIENEAETTIIGTGIGGLTLFQIYPHCDKHVVSVRITSEDPEENFRPASGEITNLNFRSTQFVWGYFSHVGAGSLHEFADSQFGHLFATGSTRFIALHIVFIVSNHYFSTSYN